MTCNKFLQNRPKKRNPTQKQPTDSPFFFFFWGAGGAPWADELGVYTKLVASQHSRIAA
jgi:hypothetical protein